MSLSLSPKAKASWELRKATKKSPWHNNHLPYIVKERTYLLGSTPCVRVGHGASIFFPRWCPSGASNFRPDMAAQCAKLHKIVSLIRISIKDSRNCNYLRKYFRKNILCVYAMELELFVMPFFGSLTLGRIVITKKTSVLVLWLHT